MPLPIVNLCTLRMLRMLRMHATLHVVKLLVERQRHMIYVKVGMFHYCFNRVRNYMLVFVMVFVSKFGRIA